MASTRNNNMIGEYTAQQKVFDLAKNYNLFKNASSGQAYETKYPDKSIIAGKRPRENLAKNAVDIESALFGINSSNLVNPQPPVTPQLILPTQITFTNERNLIMPEHFIHNSNERPHL